MGRKRPNRLHEISNRRERRKWSIGGKRNGRGNKKKLLLCEFRF